MATNIEKHRPNNRRGNPAWVKGGASPNPNGRPLKEHTLINIAQDLLRGKAPEEQDKTMAQALVEQWLVNCLKGNAPLFKELLDRLYGKVPQPIAGVQGRPIEVKSVDDISQATDEQLAVLAAQRIVANGNGGTSEA